MGRGGPSIGVIVLAPVGSRLLVPLFVTRGEASIGSERRSAGSEPAGLPRTALSALDARLAGVVLDGTDTPAARVEIEVRGRNRAVAGPIAEALEWALDVGAPIWLSAALVRARGIEQAQLEKLAPGLTPKDEPPAGPTRSAPTF